MEPCPDQGPASRARVDGLRDLRGPASHRMDSCGAWVLGVAFWAEEQDAVGFRYRDIPDDDILAVLGLMLQKRRLEIREFHHVAARAFFLPGFFGRGPTQFEQTPFLPSRSSVAQQQPPSQARSSVQPQILHFATGTGSKIEWFIRNR